MRRLSSKKTIIVTGHRGFIMSHLTDALLSAGHKVIGIDKLTYASNKDLEFKGDFSEIIADISELTSLPFCDIIINGAAESHVDNSINGNDVFLKSNVLGVHRILELLKNKRIENLMHSWSYVTPLFVQISTDETFGDIENGSFKEYDRHKPSNPYAATKSAAEQLVFAWGRTYNIPYIITRTTNNYGPGQHEEKLIPRTIVNLLQNKKAIVHGNGSYIRNWIHVFDNVEAIQTIIDVGNLNDCYHIASNEEYSVKSIVTKICDKLQLDYKASVDSNSDRSGADVRYALNYDKLLGLGWKQKRNLDSSLSELIDCYRGRI